jgi:hypothetical protein
MSHDFEYDNNNDNDNKRTLRSLPWFRLCRSLFLAPLDDLRRALHPASATTGAIDSTE